MVTAEDEARVILHALPARRRKSFFPIFGKKSRFDMMNQFVASIGSGHFACPGGVAEGDWIGRALFEA